MLKPAALKPGDKVAIVAPSTPADPARVHKAAAGIANLGLEPVLYPTCFKAHGHLAGTDSERVTDIHQAFADPEIKGIICLKGGSGAYRLLPLLNYDLIRENPKVFVGYSDITALHMAFNKICRMVTYHGPMALSDLFMADQEDPYTLASYRHCLFSTEPMGILANPPGEALEVLVSGTAQGELIGGNLSLLVSTLGSPYEVDVRGKILFIEEVSEAVYRVDRMINALALAGKFSDCAGVILGTWSGCVPEKKESYGGEDLPLRTVFEELLAPYGKPVLVNLRAGHNSPQPTLAFGTQVRITSDPEIRFLEAGNL